MQSALTSDIRKSLSYVCKYYGTRPDLVQAGGGNISIKDRDKLYIKSSGCALFDVEPDKNMSMVDLVEIKDYNSSISEKDFLQSATLSGNQPSLETFFHAKTLKYTVHLHPVVVIQALALHKCDFITKYEDSVEFVDYYKPGFELSDHIECDKKIIFLSNHGLIVHSDDLLEVADLIDKILKFSSSLLEWDLEQYNKISYVQNYLYEKFNEICYVLPTRVSMDNLRVTPDCIIYSGGFVHHTGDDHSIRPTCLSYNDDRFIASKSFLRCKQIEQVLEVSEKITDTSLSISDMNNLLNWDSEKYRQKED